MARTHAGRGYCTLYTPVGASVFLGGIIRNEKPHAYDRPPCVVYNSIVAKHLQVRMFTTERRLCDSFVTVRDVFDGMVE